MCTNTHASLHAEGFNVFEDGALEYLLEACALTPMTPSMQRVSMFLKVWWVDTNTDASFCAEGLIVFDGEALEYLFDPETTSDVGTEWGHVTSFSKAKRRSRPIRSESQATNQTALVISVLF